MIEEKIIQIIPAPENMYAEYKDEDNGDIFHMRIVCLGLTNLGEVVLMDITDGDGVIDIVSDNLIGIVFK